MNEKTITKIEEMLCKELDNMAARGDISMAKLDMLHKLTDTIKNLYKIDMYSSESGYSNDGMWTAHGGYSNNGNYSNGNSYDNGNSYSNRGKHYVRGHYSRDNGGGYSRDNAKHDMISELENMMSEAHDDKTRDALRRCMEQVRSL